MTLEEECRLSYYREIAVLNEEHRVSLVQHGESGRIYVKKVLSVYDPAVFRYLREHHVSRTPVIYEAVESADGLTLIEEYISGQTLREVLEERGILPEEEAYRLAADLCRILCELHAAVPPIIHRDIKPSNIMITPEGELRLLDMNAAKYYRQAARDTQLIGTHGYAAPEQYGFGASDVRTDIYSVGVVINQMLTGHFPNEQMAQGRLGRIAERCVRMNPEERYPSAAALLAALCGNEEDASVGPENVQAGKAFSQKPAGGGQKAGNDGWRSFLPPGFRSGNPAIMLFSAMGYLLMLSVILDYRGERNASDPDWAGQVGMTLAVLLPVLFMGNYRNVQERVGLNRVENRFLRWLLILAGDVALFFLAVLVLMILDAVF